MLSSSLGNWNGEASAPVVPAPNPMLTISPSDPSLSVSLASPIQVIPSETSFSYGYAVQTTPPTSLIAPNADLDYDRTPRRADFAPNVQDIYSQQYATASMAYMQPVSDTLAHVLPSEAYALESYSEGLDAFDIAPAIYDMSPFDDVDFSDFLHVSPEPARSRPTLPIPS